jgi:hypothetical protein
MGQYNKGAWGIRMRWEERIASWRNDFPKSDGSQVRYYRTRKTSNN